METGTTGDSAAVAAVIVGGGSNSAAAAVRESTAVRDTTNTPSSLPDASPSARPALPGVTFVRGNALVVPPPIKQTAFVVSPLGPTDSDDERAAEAERHRVAVKPPPPDIADAGMTAQLEALALLAAAEYGGPRTDDTGAGGSAGLPLPKELLAGTDLCWTFAGRFHQNETFSAFCERHGHRTIATIASAALATHSGATAPLGSPMLQLHSSSTVLSGSATQQHGRGSSSHAPAIIDSPRSLLALMQAGYNASTLMPQAEPSAEQRRLKILNVLSQQYTALCDKYSKPFIVSFVHPHAPPIGQRSGSRSPQRATQSGSQQRRHHRPLGYISPAARRGASPAADGRRRRDTASGHGHRRSTLLSSIDERELPPSAVAAKGAQKSRADAFLPPVLSPPREGTHPPQDGAAPAPRAATSKHIERLLRHREFLTAEWGMRQQQLANTTYALQRAASQIEAVQEERARRARSLLGGSHKSLSPPRQSAHPSSVVAEGSRGEGVEGEHYASRPATRTEGMPPDGHRLSRQSTDETPQQTDVQATAGLARRTTAAFPSAHYLLPSSHQTVTATTSASGGSSCGGGARNNSNSNSNNKSGVVDVKTKLRMAQALAKQREQDRLRQLEAAMKAKDANARVAARRHDAERAALKAEHDAKRRAAREVKERQLRAADFKRLLLIQSLEGDAVAAAVRDSAAVERRHKLQNEHRLRNSVEAETQRFVRESNEQLQKALCYQEIHVAAQAPLDDLRTMKEQSKRRLKALLRKEDTLIKQWKELESLSEQRDDGSV